MSVSRDTIPYSKQHRGLFRSAVLCGWVGVGCGVVEVAGKVTFLFLVVTLPLAGLLGSASGKASTMSMEGISYSRSTCGMPWWREVAPALGPSRRQGRAGVSFVFGSPSWTGTIAAFDSGQDAAPLEVDGDDRVLRFLELDGDDRVLRLGQRRQCPPTESSAARHGPEPWARRATRQPQEPGRRQAGSGCDGDLPVDASVGTRVDPPGARPATSMPGSRAARPHHLNQFKVAGLLSCSS
jgi:hypothetical protein